MRHVTILLAVVVVLGAACSGGADSSFDTTAAETPAAAVATTVPRLTAGDSDGSSAASNESDAAVEAADVEPGAADLSASTAAEAAPDSGIDESDATTTSAVTALEATDDGATDDEAADPGESDDVAIDDGASDGAGDEPAPVPASTSGDDGTDPSGDDLDGAPEQARDAVIPPQPTTVGGNDAEEEETEPSGSPAPSVSSPEFEDEETAAPPTDTELVVAQRIGTALAMPADLVERIESGVTTEVCLVELPYEAHESQVQPLPFDPPGTPYGDLIALANDALDVHVQLVSACVASSDAAWNSAKQDLAQLTDEAVALAEQIGLGDSVRAGLSL